MFTENFTFHNPLSIPHLLSNYKHNTYKYLKIYLPDNLIFFKDENIFYMFFSQRLSNIIGQ